MTASRSIGRYELVAPIASGGMGQVFRARLRGEGGFVRDFALKVLHSHIARDREAIAMFLDEARVAAAIRHPNVVTTLDSGRDGDDYYVVMDLVDGGSVAELLSGDVPIPPAIAASIAIDALTGLDAAHSARGAEGQALHVVHRDVSPANILVGRDGVARLSDFGIAKAEERIRSTAGAEVKGKVGYMAPEQLDGDKVDARADLFSFGVLLWEMLTAGSMLHGNRRRIRELEEGPCPEWFPTGAGASVDDVIRRALRASPSERFDDARSMRLALESSFGDTVATAAEVSDFVRERFVAAPQAVEGGIEREAAIAPLREHTADVVQEPAWAPPAMTPSETSAPLPTRRRISWSWLAIAGGVLVIAASLVWRRHVAAPSDSGASSQVVSAAPSDVAVTALPAPSSVLVPFAPPTSSVLPAPALASVTTRRSHGAPRSPPKPTQTAANPDQFGGRR